MIIGGKHGRWSEVAGLTFDYRFFCWRAAKKSNKTRQASVFVDRFLKINEKLNKDFYAKMKRKEPMHKISRGTNIPRLIFWAIRFESKKN